MNQLQQIIPNYLDYCHYQKKLNSKTLKAYRIDLTQFLSYMQSTNFELNRSNLSKFIINLHKQYKPKSVKRKMASVKALFTYLEYEDIIPENPFAKLNIKFKEPILLPRTISINNLQQLFIAAYKNINSTSNTDYQKNTAIRDVAVLELLFATGLRVSELCSLRHPDIDLHEGYVRIYGKGSKERIVQITNTYILDALRNYCQMVPSQTITHDFFFVNRLGHRLSEQSVRFMIKNTPI